MMGMQAVASIKTKDTKAFFFYFECFLNIPNCLLRFHNLLIKTSRVCRTQTSSHKDFSNTREFSGKRVKLIAQNCKNRGNCHNSWIFRESSSQNCLLSQQMFFLEKDPVYGGEIFCKRRRLEATHQQHFKCLAFNIHHRNSQHKHNTNQPSRSSIPL